MTSITLARPGAASRGEPIASSRCPAEPERVGLTRPRHSIAPAAVYGLLRKGKEGEMSSSLDRDRQRALMTRTGAGLPARLDLAPVGDIAAKSPEVLVVDVIDMVHAKAADLAPRIVAAPTAAKASPPWRSTITTIARLAWATVPRTSIIGATGSIEAAGSRVSLFGHRLSLLFRSPGDQLAGLESRTERRPYLHLHRCCGRRSRNSGRSRVRSRHQCRSCD